MEASEQLVNGKTEFWCPDKLINDDLIKYPSVDLECLNAVDSECLNDDDINEILCSDSDSVNNEINDESGFNEPVHEVTHADCISDFLDKCNDNVRR